jgi:DHA2 family multidrug resistance protein-like MFS transporter
VPPDKAGSGAREGIDRAVHAAGQLPAGQRDDLLAAARDAFCSGVHVVGVVSALRYAVLAVLAVRAFRHVRNSQGDDDTTDDTTDTTDDGRGAVPEAASPACCRCGDPVTR